MSVIQIDAVRKDFKGNAVLKAVSLEIRARELCVLLGPSGCGKTTLLRIIAGLETETSGTVSIGGSKINGLAPRDRKIAMVFQNYAVFPHMTIGENIAFGLRGHRHSGSAFRHRPAGALQPRQGRAPAGSER